MVGLRGDRRAAGTGRLPIPSRFPGISSPELLSCPGEASTTPSQPNHRPGEAASPMPVGLALSASPAPSRVLLSKPAQQISVSPPFHT